MRSSWWMTAMILVGLTGCGVDDPSAPAAVEQAVGGDCYVGAVVDRGLSGDLHYWEIYGDFRCGHSESFPSLVDPIIQGCRTVRSVNVTYTSSFQINVAMGPTWVASCLEDVSSWNQIVGDIQFVR